MFSPLLYSVIYYPKSAKSASYNYVLVKKEKCNMFEWLIKKIIVGKINDLLKMYKGNIDKARQTLKLWTTRIEKVLACLNSMLAKLDDD